VNGNRGLYSHGARTLEFLPFESGTTKSIDIPREAFLKRLVMRFSATAVVAGGANSGVVNEDAVLRLIDSIELVGNGVADRVILDARGLYHMNTIMRGVAPAILNPADGNIGNKPINVLLELNLANKFGVNPADSILRTMDFTSLKLRVRWANPNTMFGGAYDRTCTIANNFGIETIMYETLAIAPTTTRLMDYQELEYAAATTQLEVDLPLQRMYQGVFIMATLDGVRSDALINNITFKTAQTLRQWDRVPYVNIREELAAKSGLAALPTGCALALLTEDGMITSGLNAYRTNTCKAIFDVNAPAGVKRIRVYSDSFLL